MSTRMILPGHVGFHSGELAVQRRAGVEAAAARLRRMVAPGELRGGVAALLAGASFAAVTARDRDGRLWISPVTGQPGFLATTTPTQLSMRTALEDDPLYGLDEGQPVGIIVMDFAAKRRVRINGTLSEVDGGTIEVDVEQAYGNCPQYIRRRHLSPVNAAAATDFPIRRDERMVARDIELIRSADTFFLGTTHPERGNDASHRGGPAGFVRADQQTVEWPDYPGNNMFNSLGNLAVDPTAALLFIDFASGCTLQLSGSAHVAWHAAASDGDTGRRVQFSTERVVARRLVALRAV